MRGKLLPEHWETLYKSLGRMGLEWDEPHDKQRERGPLSATRQDFLDFAKESGLPPPTAGRAWRILVEAFERKVNPDFYTHLQRYDYERLGELPLVFNVYPTPQRHAPWDRLDKELVSGLDVPSLQALVNIIDGSMAENGTWPGIAAVLGFRAGPPVIEFWRGFAASRLSELDS